MNYWRECVEEALSEAGLQASTEQVNIITDIVEGAHDNYSQATGQDCIPNPMIRDIEQLKEKHKREIYDLETQIVCYRRSVAERRQVDLDEVRLEDGKVMYGKTLC